jgi:exosortase/archaeosortase family protein
MEAPSNPAPAGGERLLAWLTVAATGAIFWPVTRWIVAEAATRAQIRQAAILLGAAAGLIVWRHRMDLRVRGDVGNRTLWLLGAAFAAAAAAAQLGWSWLVLPAFALALAGCLQALFGPAGFVFFRPLVAGVAVLMGIIVAFPLLDWPLRQLAGLGAGLVLAKLGLAPNLALAGTVQDPQLVLSVAGGHFLVATECNGFGLITSGVLVAVLAAGIAGRRWWTIVVLALAGLGIGFLFNLSRILVIATTARYFPGHYDALHEIVGTLALWAGLGLVVWLAWREPPGGPASCATLPESGGGESLSSGSRSRD